MTDTQTLRIGIIGGSGIGEALNAESGELHHIDTPFGSPSSPLTLTQWSDVEIVLLQRHGIGHIYNPSQVPYRANIFAMKKMGITHLIATGATGSLREHIHPADLVIVDQVIDKTHQRPSTFFEHGAVHVELSEPFCPVMRHWLIDAGKKLDDVTLHESGTYVCMEGPAFSTKAESHMHRAWGGDLIGMTAMPEAKLAREAELPFTLVSLPTDYDCWRPHDPNMTEQALIAEIIGNLKQATQNAITLIKTALSDCNALSEPSPAWEALKLGIWSDKSQLDPEEIERLDLLWGKYFSG